MPRKIEIKYDWRIPTAKIFRIFGADKWTAEEIRDIVEIKNLQGFTSNLHYTGIIKPYGGLKRCKTRKPNQSGGTEWVFSPWFIDYMNSGGVELFESATTT